MKLIYIPFILGSLLSFSQSVEERIDQTFQDSFKNKDLECFYFQAKENVLISPKSQTNYSDEILKRDFVINYNSKKLNLSFKLFNSGGISKYNVTFNNNLVYEGGLNQNLFAKLMEFGDGGFFVSNLVYKSGDQSLAQKYNLGKVKCNLEIAKSKPIVLSGKHHINVHPHTRYDYYGLLNEKLSKLYSSMDSYVLIDSANRQGAFINYYDFLKTGSYKVPYEIYQTLIDIPSGVPMVISPAGYNDYVYQDKKNIEISFSGGNHNYCIWNNTRNLMWGLFYSNKNSNLKINYLSDSMVVQRSGIIPGTSFKRKHVKGSNVLGDIFNKFPEIQNSYHRSYNYYFQKDFILRFTGLFKTLKYSYEAPNFKEESIIQGKGTRDLVIELKYL